MAFQDPLDSPLLQSIINKRTRMTVGQRRTTRKRPSRQSWLYPRAIERGYKQEITKLMRAFTRPAYLWLESNYQRMLRDFRGDEAFIGKAGTVLKSHLKAYLNDRWDKGFKAALREDNPNFEVYQPNGVRVDELPDDMKDLNSFLHDIDSKLFVSQEAERLAYLKGVAHKVESYNQGQFGKFINQYADGLHFPPEPWLPAVTNTWADTNFTLIRSLSGEYVKRLNVMVSDAVMDGRTWDAVSRDVRGLNKNITQSRADLLASDQIGKLNGRITEKRQTEAGIDQYTWSTALDERVRGNPFGKYPKSRPSHFVMEGKRCRWDDPTKYSKDKGKTWIKRSGKMPKQHPGIPIRCRCNGAPVFDELMRAADNQIEVGVIR